METLLNAIATLFAFAFGASIGSFLNVVIYRVPAGLSLIHPPSRCPKCSHQLGSRENVPIFGWLWLKGHCRWCKAPISIRYPLVETATALLFCLVFWKFGFSITTGGYWAFLSWLLALSLIDLDTMTLPNSLTESGLVLGLIFQATRSGFDGSEMAINLILGIIGAVLGLWLFDIIRWVGTIIFQQEAMGGGDPKLAAMIGAWLGWKYLLLTGFLACALGAFFGIVAILSTQMGRRHPIRFGPFLGLGAALALFWGESLISTYIKLFFPLS
ncbi:peptidase A24A domain protein [Gloeothece citriformis PCC 7424]|uniref:Prepilin leader peptidase/N-methyltransferase n=1 Tax=Gloeothece citriformis (strain PCC 7424) TaxID=65393 RepID=B7KBP3_GLOC7|nr:A24 family peptidase [Gloeothece citriformis]ACK73021.1 peptidase A24A domain protein [Gloeothece citriformis PCC 7424]